MSDTVMRSWLQTRIVASVMGGSEFNRLRRHGSRKPAVTSGVCVNWSKSYDRHLEKIRPKRRALVTCQWRTCGNDGLHQ